MDSAGSVRILQSNSFPGPAWGPPGQGYAPAGPGQRIFDEPGAGTFIVPVGVTSAVVELWAGGGGGGTANVTPGGGGGGGAYVRQVVTLVPGAEIPYHVGTGGPAGTLGELTGWNAGDYSAVPGAGGTPSAGGAGGNKASCEGEVKWSGGAGRAYITTSGGGGGSSSGGDSDGVAATTTDGAIAPDGGGSGGDGSIGAVGNPGVVPGGGGGGGGLPTFAGGVGASGRVKITWPAP